MLKDAKTRSLAIEFGTQWIHVRGFDELKEKNEKLFPTFTPELRKAIYEESILFFLDLFQSDRTVTSILDADHTYLNETLAKHYGVPGVTGPQWRKVDGVRKYGRGGVLGLASVQTKEAGASRTSPVLRGNWLVETLLGEKLPRSRPRTCPSCRKRKARTNSRCGNWWRSTHRCRRARCVTSGSTRSASRWRSTTRSADGARRIWAVFRSM